jgi:hypothetical protein
MVIPVPFMRRPLKMKAEAVKQLCCHSAVMEPWAGLEKSMTQTRAALSSFGCSLTRTLRPRARMCSTDAIPGKLCDGLCIFPTLRVVAHCLRSVRSFGYVVDGADFFAGRQGGRCDCLCQYYQWTRELGTAKVGPPWHTLWLPLLLCNNTLATLLCFDVQSKSALRYADRQDPP